MTTQQDTPFAAARTGRIRVALSAATLSLLIALITIRAGAQTYDAAAEFSGTDNPNGVWSYGCTGSQVRPSTCTRNRLHSAVCITGGQTPL